MTPRLRPIPSGNRCPTSSTTDSSRRPPAQPPVGSRPNPMTPSSPSVRGRSRCALRASAPWRSRSRWQARGIRSGWRLCRVPSGASISFRPRGARWCRLWRGTRPAPSGRLLVRFEPLRLGSAQVRAPHRSPTGGLMDGALRRCSALCFASAPGARGHPVRLHVLSALVASVADSNSHSRTNEYHLHESNTFP